MTNLSNEQRLDLLAAHALLDLSNGEAEQLTHTTAEERADFDRTAALLAAGFAEADAEPMPASLASRIRAAAADSVSTPASNTDSAPAPISIEDAPQRRVPWLASAGWFVAAAAILLSVSLIQFQTSNATPEQLSLAEQVDALKAVDATQSTTWGPWVPILSGESGPPMDYAANVSGEVVWNQETQEGFMVFENLPVNEPTVEQYQLWIVDGRQQYPVDGGVFDVTAEGTAIVPIRAAIDIKSPAAFGITVEEPGGVVVSDRTRRVVVGAL